MTNSTSTDATIGGAWCTRMIREQGCHSNTKYLNKDTPNHPRICQQGFRPENPEYIHTISTYYIIYNSFLAEKHF